MAIQFLFPVLFWGLVEFLTLDSMTHLCPYNKSSVLVFAKGIASSFLLHVLSVSQMTHYLVVINKVIKPLTQAI